jgi:hypothetical protein
MRVLSIGDQVQNGIFRIHSVFGRAVNWTDGTCVVSLVSPEIGAGPVNVVVEAMRAEVSAGGSAARETGFGRRSLIVAGEGASGRAVVVDGRSLDTARAASFESSIVLPPWDRRVLARNLDVLGRVLVESAPQRSLAFLLDPRRTAEFRPGFERAIATHIADCARDAVAWDVSRAVGRLKGCGFGLTPSGDDFICGMLVALHVGETGGDVSLEPLRTTIRDAAHTGNSLTDTFLALACDGCVSERTQRLVHALVAGSAADVVAAARRVIAVGETSGADFATGLLMNLRACAPRRAATPTWALARCGVGEVGFRC